MGGIVDFQSQHHDSPSVLLVTLLPAWTPGISSPYFSQMRLHPVLREDHWSKVRQGERNKECCSTLNSSALAAEAF